MGQQCAEAWHHRSQMRGNTPTQANPRTRLSCGIGSAQRLLWGIFFLCFVFGFSKSAQDTSGAATLTLIADVKAAFEEFASATTVADETERPWRSGHADAKDAAANAAETGYQYNPALGWISDAEKAIEQAAAAGKSAQDTSDAETLALLADVQKATEELGRCVRALLMHMSSTSA